MTLKQLLLLTSFVVAPATMLWPGSQPVLAQAQGAAASVLVPPASLTQPLKDSWHTYSGDYTGRRYSALTQINKDTVKNLTLAWMATLDGSVPAAANPAAAAGAGAGAGGRGGGGGGGRGGGAAAGRLIVGGPGTGDYPIGAATL